MVQMPDAPLALSNNPAITTATKIGLVWSAGMSNGGKTIINYRVSFDQGIGTYVVLQTGITVTSYTALTLTHGTTYKFKVQARNSVGFSAYSSEVSILAAQVPNQPLTPQTLIIDETVVVSWKSPYNGGSAITSFSIQIR
jgi:hypothetical protein